MIAHDYQKVAHDLPKEMVPIVHIRVQKKLKYH